MTSNDYITFAGVKFHSPIADSMRKLNLINPSSIQSIAIAPVMSGLSCIIHAETGQGKTLTYLLPLLKRLSLIDQRNNAIPQSVIIVPTKELAIQVTSDIFSLINDPNLVHLCIQKQLKGLHQINKSILVGLAEHINEILLLSPEDSIMNINYVVLDEVDRLLEVLGKYATGEDKSKKRKSVNYTEKSINKIIELRTKNDKLNELQVIAASATVGRPLRRELQKILNPSIGYGDELPLFRPNNNIIESRNDDKVMKSTRNIVIPKSIIHNSYLFSEESINENSLSKKISVFSKYWNKEYSHISNGIIFVPSLIDVATVVGMLKFWNIPEVINLQESLGIQSDSDFPWKRQNKDKPVKIKHTISQILATATENKLGNANRLLVNESNARKLYITTVESARGLHIQDIDVVFISHLPYIMDEYLHMAGRTGRIGNKNPNGVVVSVVDLDEYKRLQSWQSPLGIEINFK